MQSRKSAAVVQSEALAAIKNFPKLDAGDRILMALHYFESLEVEEIAIVLGQSPETTRTALNRVLSKMARRTRGNRKSAPADPAS